MFAQLQSSLNQIWHVTANPKASWKDTLRRRSLTFVLLFAVAALMLSSLALSVALGAVGRFVTG